MTAVSLGVPTRRSDAAARRNPDDLQALVVRGVLELGVSPAATDVAAWAAAAFPSRLAVACSMQDAVLPHLVSRFAPGIDVLFLETGYHFSDTLVTRDLVAQALPVNVIDVRAEQSVAEQDRHYGEQLYERDPAQCCQLRKVEPLARALAGYEAWVTGVRRDEAATRSETPVLTWDAKNAMVKLNPLAAWTHDDVLAYAAEHRVVTNALLTDGYPSIGCQPCTHRPAPGDDPRAGRWAGLVKTECGLHL